MTALLGILALVIASIALLADSRGEERAAGSVSREQSSATPASVVRNASATLSRRGARRRYWGAWIGDQLTGVQAPFDWNAVTKFERIAGKRLSIVHWGSPFANCATRPCSFYPFPWAEVIKVRRHGAIPMLSWSSASIPGGRRQRAFQLRDITSGRYDRYIRSFARKARQWGHPFFLRFNWEMNSNWFPWGVDANGNRVRHYVPAWRHVHRIFDRVGARNASWVWCPYVDLEHKYNLRRLYPGPAFVDWTCLDGYNWGPRSPANPRPWRSFGELFRETYRRIVRGIARRKPMIIAEVASSGYGGNKAAWIRNMLAELPRRYPKVRGLVYFNVIDRGAGWPIERPRRVRRAFRRGINRPAYVPNRFRRIARSPIRPPGRR
jgi:Glycosyl hydrolase family 26